MKFGFAWSVWLFAVVASALPLLFGFVISAAGKWLTSFGEMFLEIAGNALDLLDL